MWCVRVFYSCYFLFFFNFFFVCFECICVCTSSLFLYSIWSEWMRGADRLRAIAHNEWWAKYGPRNSNKTSEAKKTSILEIVEGNWCDGRRSHTHSTHTYHTQCEQQNKHRCFIWTLKSNLLSLDAFDLVNFIIQFSLTPLGMGCLVSNTKNREHNILWCSCNCRHVLNAADNLTWNVYCTAFNRHRSLSALLLAGTLVVWIPIEIFVCRQLR